jgi:sugar/nucleoside kinase (ribokinase family)
MESQKKLDVICIGSSSKDVFFPVTGAQVIDTPDDLTAQKKVLFELGGKYKVDDRYEAVGGVAANVSQGLSLLGVRSACYTKVGGDELGRWIKDELAKRGVGAELVFVDETVRSDLSAIVVLTESGERTIFHNRDANERLEIIPEKLDGAAWFFVSALNGDWKGHLRSILDIAKEHGMKLAINPSQHGLREDPELVLEAASRSDILVINKDEALELAMRSGASQDATELNDERFLIQALHKAGAKLIGMTDGARGAWGSDGNGIWHCPIGHVEKVIDSTGAGDAFGAAFLAAHLLGKPISEMLAWGIAESGSVVTEYGANTGLLDRETIESRTAELKPEQVERI